jgi:hypothetical protein
VFGQLLPQLFDQRRLLCRNISTSKQMTHVHFWWSGAPPKGHATFSFSTVILVIFGPMFGRRPDTLLLSVPPCVGVCRAAGASVTVNPSTAAHADSQTLGKTEQINYLSGCFHKKKKRKLPDPAASPQKRSIPPLGRQTQILGLQLFICRHPTASWRQFECRRSKLVPSVMILMAKMAALLALLLCVSGRLFFAGRS